MAGKTTHGTEVAYLVVGKTGVGKTSLINSVAGEIVAEEGDDLDIGTFTIESHQVTHESSGTTCTIRFWDTPGLFDMTKRSDSYVDKIRDKYEHCDVVLYCTDMTDTRVTQQDKRTIDTFTEPLGVAFWKRSIFVLTFANYVVDPRSGATAEYFEQKRRLLQDSYCKVIRETGISADAVSKIPFVPAGYHPWSKDKEMHILPGGHSWISAFWMSCLARVKDSPQVPRNPQPAARHPVPATPSPTREQCTFQTTQRRYARQDWFECHTCWGGNSSFGCCLPCALDCHRGHQLVRRHKSDEGCGFFCDCGLNKHQPAVCTFYSTKTEFRIQPYYRCHSCFSHANVGVCHQCMINCHHGHNISYAGELSCFCDCGLQYCISQCQISQPF